MNLLPSLSSRDTTNQTQCQHAMRHNNLTCWQTAKTTLATGKPSTSEILNTNTLQYSMRYTKFLALACHANPNSRNAVRVLCWVSRGQLGA